MKWISPGLFSFCLFISMSALAQTAELPNVLVGDAWVFQRTMQTPKEGFRQMNIELVVTRVTSSRLFHSIRVVGSPQPAQEMIVHRDWSRSRSINGVETLTIKPFDFPLHAGKSWGFVLEENAPEVDRLKSMVIKMTYKVVGIEDVDVPAGKYKAWRIEGEGTWTGTRKPEEVQAQGTHKNADSTVSITTSRKSGQSVQTGRIYSETWYVPEIKNFVKDLVERYDPSGIRYASDMKELVSFKEGAKVLKE